MGDLLLWAIIFVVTLAILILSAEFFIKTSERLGVAFGIPPFIIGVTLVALGTSLPELITSVIAVLDGRSEIVLGNVVGSNISNLCLIVGVLGVLGRKVVIEFDLMRLDIPMLFGTSVLLWLSALDGKFSFGEGVVFLLILGLYLAYFIKSDRPVGPEFDEENVTRPRRVTWREPVILMASVVGLYFSADYNVNAIIRISEILGIGADLIAVTAVALGTSLPELMVSIVAVRKGQGDIAIGNVIGSNIFNILGVMGFSRLFGVVLISNEISVFSLPLMLGVTVLFIFITMDKIVNRWEGGLLLGFYAFFLMSTIFG